MGHTYYIRFGKSSDSTSRAFENPLRVLTDPRRFSNPTTAEIVYRYCPPATLATCWELLFAILSSILTTTYTIHHENRVVRSSTDHLNTLQSQILAFDLKEFSFVLDPPPVLMLFCCLLLGCSISSFCYRRQETDRFQTPIFVLTLLSATGFGLWTGVAGNLIMLGLIPWAACFSMLCSASAHWFLGRYSRRAISNVLVCRVDEKELLPSALTITQE